MQIKVDLKIFLFFLIFLVTHKIKIYGVIMAFSLIHELGHLICGLCLGLKPEKMTLLPYGLKISFKTKVEEYNIKIGRGNIIGVKRIILALAGPITNMICIIITYIIGKYNIIGMEDYEYIIYSNMLIALFNLLPIYPLDGGQIIKEIIHIKLGNRKSYKYTGIISEMTLYILTIMTSILIIKYKNIAMILLIIYLWFIVYKNEYQIKLKEKIYERIDNLQKENV